VSTYDLPPFSKLIGMVIKERTVDRVIAELHVTKDHTNLMNVMHGGAIMALADQCGGAATGANLRPGQVTTTVESKTNFFAAVQVGDVVTLECTPLHRGRTTMVWQTRATRSDGKLVAMVTQTQLIMSDPLVNQIVSEC
jgi:1,4-dihydroxy-2-naphthoyl-CoA hydrolase